MREISVSAAEFAAFSGTLEKEMEEDQGKGKEGGNNLIRTV